jgi:hypothetical protein
VQLGRHNEATSGGIEVGGFAGYGQGAPKIRKLFWVPTDQTAVPGKLTIIAQQLSPVAGTPMIYEFDQGRKGFTAWAADGRKFFPTWLDLRTPGTWRLVARAGASEGCFEFAF